LSPLSSELRLPTSDFLSLRPSAATRVTGTEESEITRKTKGRRDGGLGCESSADHSKCKDCRSRQLEIHFAQFPEELRSKPKPPVANRSLGISWQREDL